MTLSNLQIMLNELEQYKCTNSKAYKQVMSTLQGDVTRHNIEEARKLLATLKETK